MDRGAWGKPVVLEIYGRPGTVTVSDTLDAALFLLGAWTAKKTDTHRNAVMTCRDTLKGRATPSLSRAAFIDAALDGGYHVQPETFLDAAWQSAPNSVPSLRSTFGMEGDRRLVGSGALQGEMPHGRWVDGSDISRPVPPMARTQRRAETEPATIVDLLSRLGELMGLILLEVVRSAAGLMNIHIQRKPGKG